MIKLKKIKPLNNQILTTADVYEKDEKLGGIIMNNKSAGTVKEYQKVVAVGPFVRDIKEGDVVAVDAKNYAVKKHQEGSLKDGIITDNPVIKYRLPIIDIDDKQYMLLYDRDISFIIEDYEEIEEELKSDLYVPNNKILIN